VKCVAALPDGMHFVVGVMAFGEDDEVEYPYEVRLYHVDGTLVHTFMGTQTLMALTVTPDGQHIISGSDDMLVKVWSVATKSLMSTCDGHTTRYTRELHAVAAMPDGLRILSGGGYDNVFAGEDLDPYGEVCVHNLDGTLKNTFYPHTAVVYALVALPNNQHGLLGSEEIIKLFDVDDGAVLRTFMHHTQGVDAPYIGLMVNSLALLPDGRRFVSGACDHTACIVEHGLAPQ
jgi:WD40 repeat protein